MHLFLFGIRGRMGRQVAALCQSGYRSATVSGGVDKSATPSLSCPVYRTADLVSDTLPVSAVIDFSSAAALQDVLSFAKERNVPAVIASTGHGSESKRMIDAAAQSIPILTAVNLARGIAHLSLLAETLVAAYPDADIEIVEKHHRDKIDAPSGTALMLADRLAALRKDAVIRKGRSGSRRESGEIGIHALRMGALTGVHEIHVATALESFCIRHETHDRTLYATGAIDAAAFLLDKTPGLYTLADLYREKRP